MVLSKNNKIKVAVGLSGGVDSAVSAYLLKKAGYDVSGVYLQCWDEKADGCTAEEDRADAAKVAAHLEIKFTHLNFVKEYKNKVIKYFYSEYKKGRTPNPDVLCNKEIKFGLFLDWAIKEGYDRVATGHYTQVRKENSVFKLFQGLDVTKDQSYFLYLLDQKRLSKIMFPLGGKKKTEVRKIAKEAGFHNAKKADSVGICFIGEVNIKDFLQKEIKLKIGAVVNREGEEIGEHDGVWFYTIGQRHGFRVDKYHSLPLYVIDKDVSANELVVGYAKEGERNSFKVADLHWINEAPKGSLKCDVRIRHLGELCKAEFNKGVVRLSSSIFGVAPGQSVVFYKDSEVLGGGIIQ